MKVTVQLLQEVANETGLMINPVREISNGVNLDKTIAVLKAGGIISPALHKLYKYELQYKINPSLLPTRKGDSMCLSNVYLNEKKERKLLIEEAAQVIAVRQGVEVGTLIGNSKHLEGYFIKEVNLMYNYVILERKSSEANA